MRQKSFFGGSISMWRMRILAMLVLLVSGACALAQGGGSVAITGTVLDPTGAAIPGAKVTVVQESTSVAHTALTNASV
jgi:hypothetical protein